MCCRGLVFSGTLFFQGEFPLFACIAVVLVGQVKRIYRQIVRGMDVAGDAKVNTHTVLGVNLTKWRFLRSVLHCGHG